VGELSREELARESDERESEEGFEAEQSEQDAEEAEQAEEQQDRPVAVGPEERHDGEREGDRAGRNGEG
jgi:hypothetical protein